MTGVERTAGDRAAERRHLVCSFVSDEPGEESLFPQMSGPSSVPAFKNVYWRCMLVLFASFRRFDAAARCSIVTNADPARYCDPALLRALAALGVDVVILTFDGRGRAKVERFGNVLYVLDVLAFLREHDDSDLSMVLDPDCVFLADPAPVWAAARSGGLAYYDVGSGPDQNVADLSLRWLSSFAARQGWALRSPITHVGGEFLGVTRRELARLLDAVEAIRAADADGHLTVEEHVLSLAVALLGAGGLSLNDRIRRIWTGPRRRDAAADDMALSIWHLPREKAFGFAVLSDELLPAHRAASWTALPTGAYEARLADRMGVPGWSARKWLRETPRLITRSVGALARRG